MFARSTLLAFPVGLGTRIDADGNYKTCAEVALYGGGFTIPSQVGNGGKQLITNGTSLININDFGVDLVSCLSLVPYPPAKIIIGIINL